MPGDEFSPGEQPPREPDVLGPEDPGGAAGDAPGEGGSSSTALVSMTAQPPSVLPAVLLDDLVPFPGAVVPILLDTSQRRDAALHARANQGYLALVNRLRRGAPTSSEGPGADRPSGTDVAAAATIAGAIMNEQAHALGEDETPADAAVDESGPAGGSAPEDGRGAVATGDLTLADLNQVGIVGRILRVFQLPDQRLSALVELVRRVQVVELLREQPFVAVRVLYPVEAVGDEETLQAMFRQVRIQLGKFFEAHAGLPDEMRLAALSIPNPGALADFVAQHMARSVDERLRFLSELDVVARMRHALEVALREVDLLTVGNRITDEIRQKVERHQREFFLREQLKAIRQELGEEKDPATAALEELRERLDAAGLPPHARERADHELSRLQLISPESPEHNVIRSYLDWIATLPWSKRSEDNTDLDRARAILDADHYGLGEVKDRIIEFLAVRQLNPERSGTLLCFAGPPGVGKTSLGQSIARSLGRAFYRFSVGGMRDEAEIKGHRRTYVGAMPGRVLQALRQAGTSNPVVMLDEIDKMGSDWRGDPSSAMLEVLDPAQNATFLDHYLDLNFDLSQVMFIATANVKTEIPGPLLDRLEVIDLPGYTPEEKLEIAERHIVGRQRKAHGLTARQLRMGRPTLRHIIRGYTHEAGVRELDRLVGKVCRKRATEVVRKVSFNPTVRPEELTSFLGPVRVHEEVIGTLKPGVAVGLAWTAVGGEVLLIEAVTMAGKGQLRITGQLGEVMSESANIAVSYVRHRAEELGIDPAVFRERDIHIHFPAGAVKKDGPSAGITITTALISLLTGRLMTAKLAMTGEMTLRGEVLAVGGIREKVVAARRAGVRTVVLPERNRADVEEIPVDSRRQLRFVFASTYDQVLEAAFPTRRRKQPKPGPQQPPEGLRVVPAPSARHGRG